MKSIIYLLLILCLAIPCLVFSQDIVYMEVLDDNLSRITHDAGTQESIGQLSRQSHPHESYVFAMEYTSKYDIDPNTGVILGDAIPCVLKIKKLTDSASPKLFQSFINKENLQVNLKFWRQSLNSFASEHYYTVEVTNAKIVSFRQLKQESITGGNDITDFEEITFTYSSISLIHEIAGSSFEHSF